MSIKFVSLKEVAPSKALKNNFEDDVTLWHLNLDQIESGTGQVNNRLYAPLSEAGNSTHLFDDSNVLYSKLRPYLNKVVCPDEVGVATTELVPLKPVDGVLDKVYLAHYLRSNTFVDWVSAKVAGAKMPRVNMKDFWAHKIPLPPLAEQKRIAEILDKADALRHKQEKAITLCDDFLKALFVDMFGDPVTNPKGWELKKLGEVTHEACPVTYGIVQPGDDVTDGVPVVRPVDFDSDIVHREGLKLISPEIAGSYKRTILDGGEILICVRGTTGLLALAGGDLKGANVTRGITPVWFNSREENFFMFNQFKSHAIQTYFKENTYGATLKQINLSALREMPLVVPPLDLQNKFADIVQKTEAKKVKMQQTLDRLNDNFNALSQKAFKGEL